MKSPLERACVALCEQDSHPPYATMDGKPLWKDYIPDARAVLEAIREPTEAMIYSGAAKVCSETEAEAVWEQMIDAALKEGEMDEPTEISLGFDVVTSKDRAKQIARLRHAPVTVEFRFPIGQWQKPEDMIGHNVRLEASGAPFGEYLASAVDDRGRVVLEPVAIDSDYDWSAS